MKNTTKKLWTPESGEATNLQTKSWEVLENLSDAKKLHLDQEVLQKVMENNDFWKDQIKTDISLESIDGMVTESTNNMDTNTITNCISLLQNYADNYLENKTNSAVKTFVEEHQIEDMDEKFLALPEATRIMIAIYWSRTKKYWYSCGWWFWYFKTPTTCGWCLSWKENMEKANLVHLAKYIGERQYQVPKEKIQQAQSNFLKTTSADIHSPSDDIAKITKMYTAKLTECEEKITQQNTINEIKKGNADLTDQDLMQSMPGFVSHIASQKDAAHIQVDTEHKLAAYLQWTTRRWGSSGCEYANYVAVRYDGKRKDVHVVYRDAYNASKDNRSLCFDKVEIKNIETKWDMLHITVKASSKENSRTYTFDFPLAKEEKPSLDKEAQQKFVQTFQSKKEEIMLSQSAKYENNTMPTYCLPSDMVFDNMPWWEIPYLQPRIESEYIDKEQGIWAIVLIKQIDHGAWDKRQLAREWWIIRQDGSSDRVAYENMRDSQRASWKQISMVAQEIVQHQVNKKNK